MPAKPSKYHGYFNAFATELQNVFANDSQKHFRGTEPEEIPPEVSAKQNETGPDQAAHELVSKDKRALMVALLGTAELGRSPLHRAAQEVGIAVFEALGGIGGG